MFGTIRLPTAFVASACAAIAVMVAGAAQAVTYNFTDGTNATGTFDNTTGILTLTNTLANSGDVVGAISGINLNFASATVSPSLSSQASASGNLVSIDVGHGSSPNTYSIFGGTPTNWTLSGGGTSTLTLDANHSCLSGGGILVI